MLIIANFILYSGKARFCRRHYGRYFEKFSICMILTSLVFAASMPKLFMRRRICSLGSLLTSPRILIGGRSRGVSSVIHRCRLICSMQYRLVGSRTNIFLIRDSHSKVRRERKTEEVKFFLKKMTVVER